MIEGLDAFTEALRGQGSIVIEEPAVAGTYAPIPSTLDPRLKERLDFSGVQELFKHQRDAYDLAMQGNDLAIVTGTGSGKTLCYSLPCLQRVLREPGSRALLFFPTKALAQDQLARLKELAPPGDVRFATYDGDTPTSHRSAIRRSCDIVLTNPDMLHVGILPSHELWSRFLKQLSVIVLDEMHAYRGVFGSHVANVLRRLLRICEWAGSKPQIIACSATIANPSSLFEQLTGRRPIVLDEDAAPRSRRIYAFFNPPHIDEQNRASSNIATASLQLTLAEEGLRSLAFCRARVTTELVLQYVRRLASNSDVVTPSMFDSYRGGYTAQERRAIEQALFKGKLMGLATTNALELGVDVGGLDAVVLNGYPGSISAYRQQSGRAGRGSRQGLSIMVAADEPLEQFLVREPERILEAMQETVALKPENPYIQGRHLLCAAYERPIAPTELTKFGPSALELAEALESEGALEFRAGMFFLPSRESPARGVALRGHSTGEVRLICADEELGTMERSRALKYAHEGAVYLHRGQSYVVQRLDLDRLIATVVREDVDYYTQPLNQASVEPTVTITEAAWGARTASLIGVRVTDLVIAYRKKSLDGGRILDIIDLDMPSTSFDTVAVRLDSDFGSDGEPGELIAGFHGAEHALMAVAPLLAGCDRDDLGSAWYPNCFDTLRPAMFAFDSVPGGVGLAEALFANRKSWAMAALQLLTSCDCRDGCPACLLSSRCESGNEALHKAEAVKLLRSLLPVS